jgi:hypothetical protein
MHPDFLFALIVLGPVLLLAGFLCLKADGVL